MCQLLPGTAQTSKTPAKDQQRRPESLPSAPSVEEVGCVDTADIAEELANEADITIAGPRDTACNGNNLPFFETKAFDVLHHARGIKGDRQNLAVDDFGFFPREMANIAFDVIEAGFVQRAGCGRNAHKVFDRGAGIDPRNDLLQFVFGWNIAMRAVARGASGKRNAQKRHKPDPDCRSDALHGASLALAFAAFYPDYTALGLRSSKGCTQDMPQQVLKPGEFRVSDLSNRRETPFDLQPDADARAAIATQIGLMALKKLRFTGKIAPSGARGWTLTGRLGATVVQPCVVTLDPVTSRIDEDVERQFMPAEYFEEAEAGSEMEMPEDTSAEPLGQIISAHDAMVESLLLVLPQYPRSDSAELGDAVFAEDGVTPLKDEDTKPFAGLAALRDQLDEKS